MLLSTLSVVPSKIPGRMRFFIDRWTEITSNPYIIDIVKGYCLDLAYLTVQYNYPSYFIKTEVSSICSSAGFFV